jgi:hypothetical protein
MLATELSSGINVFSILSMFNVNLFSSAKVSIISDCAKYFQKKLNGRNLWQLVATIWVPKCRTFAIANKERRNPSEEMVPPELELHPCKL